MTLRLEADGKGELNQRRVAGGYLRHGAQDPPGE
jgi:hypothetical protein